MPTTTQRINGRDRFTAQHPCPICGGHQGLAAGHGARCWGYLSPDGEYAWCTRTEHAGQLAAAANSAYRHKLAGDCRCGLVHHPAPATLQPQKRRPAEPDRPPVAPDIVDRVYRRYLQLCPLRPEHAAYYARRGAVDAEAAATLGYGSLPMGTREMAGVVDVLSREFGAPIIAAVPGFWRSQASGMVVTHAASAQDDAAVIPCRDREGRITALVRHTITGEQAKYRVFSGSSQPVTTIVRGDATVVWLTEGIHKAHVAALAGDITVVGMSGSHLGDGAMQALVDCVPWQVIVAYDADSTTNPDVARELRKAITRLLDVGICDVALATWDPSEGKGLDDVLQGGHRPSVLPVNTAPTEPPPPPSAASPTAPDGSAQLSGSALAAARKAEWLGARGFRDVDFVTLGVKVTKSTSHAQKAPPLNMIRASEGLDKDALHALLVAALGADHAAAKASRQCGWRAGLECATHGERAATRVTCKLGAHTGCPTPTTNRLALAVLPDMDGDACYRSVWIEYPLRMRGANVQAWQDQFRAAGDAWSTAVAKARRSKRWSSSIVGRGIAYWLDERESLVQLRLQLQETTHGDTDDMVAQLEAQFGGIVAGDVRTQSGETAVVQAMEDAASTLLGMAEPDHTALFEAWWFGTKGARSHQSYGPLYNAERQREKEAPPVCDVCGERLHIRAHDPAFDRPETATHRTAWGAPAATAPPPPIQHLLLR